MKTPKFVRENLLLKITSLNALSISVRLCVSMFIQRILAEMVGEAGIAKIGQLRNITQILTSISSLGIFSGVVKYIAQYKEDEKQLQKLFSTSFVFILIGSFTTATFLLLASRQVSHYLFSTAEYAYLIKLMAVVVPFIAIQQIFNAVVNGLSKYKKFALIDLVGYLVSSALTIFFLFQYSIDGVLIAIAVTPVIQLLILLFIFIKTLKEYIHFSELSFKIPFAKDLLTFSLMSFFSIVLFNYVEIGIRSMLIRKISEIDAGIWTAMLNISKNYMVFSNALFSLYVLPKFAGIHKIRDFKKELYSIYTTLLPLFGLGMIIIYFARNLLIQLVYPDFIGLAPLFKWQLMADFVKLASIILAHQFLAKKMVKSFIFSEIVSLALFFGLAYFLTDIYGVEGVVIANLIRYCLYFLFFLFLIIHYFKKN